MSSFRRDRNRAGNRSESESGGSDRGAGSGKSKSVLRLRSAPVRVLRCPFAVRFDPLLNLGVRHREDGFRGVAESLKRDRTLDHLRLLNHRVGYSSKMAKRPPAPEHSKKSVLCPPLDEQELPDDARVRLATALEEINKLMRVPESGLSLQLVRVVNMRAIRHRIYLALAAFVAKEMLPGILRNVLDHFPDANIDPSKLQQLMDGFSRPGVVAIEKRIVSTVEAAIDAACEQAIQRLTFDAYEAVLSGNPKYTTSAKGTLVKRLREAIEDNPIAVDVDARGGRQRVAKEPSGGEPVDRAKRALPRVMPFWKWVFERLDEYDDASVFASSKPFGRLPESLQPAAVTVLAELPARRAKSGRAAFPSTLARRHAALATGDPTLAALTDRELTTLLPAAS